MLLCYVTYQIPLVPLRCRGQVGSRARRRRHTHAPAWITRSGRRFSVRRYEWRRRTGRITCARRHARTQEAVAAGTAAAAAASDTYLATPIDSGRCASGLVGWFMDVTRVSASARARAHSEKYAARHTRRAMFELWCWLINSINCIYIIIVWMYNMLCCCVRARTRIGATCGVEPFSCAFFFAASLGCDWKPVPHMRAYECACVWHDEVKWFTHCSLAVARFWVRAHAWRSHSIWLHIVYRSYWNNVIADCPSIIG